MQALPPSRRFLFPGHPPSRRIFGLWLFCIKYRGLSPIVHLIVTHNQVCWTRELKGDVEQS